jgi:gluconokinase
MIVVVMGVTGAGKTTVGRLLAERLGGVFLDADDFHPAENVEKMRAGRPLTDDDRWPWLARLNEVLAVRARRGESVVLACSALKRSYREALARDVAGLRIVYLRGTRELLADRLAARKGHYMNPALLDSQLETLEEPADALVASVDAAPELIVDQILARL